LQEDAIWRISLEKLTTRGTIVIIEAEKQQDNNYDNNAAGTAEAITTASETKTHKYSSFIAN
jgi:hypothetical protein